MSIIVTAPIETLFRFSGETEGSFEEFRRAIGGKTMQVMFSRFGVPPQEEDACLLAIYEGRFGTVTLSKDSAELISYVKKILDNRSSILPFLSLVKKDQFRILETVVALARSYLPENASLNGLEVVFAPLPYNIAAEGGNVFIDPIYAFDMGTDLLQLVLAHAVHHVGRDSVTPEFNIDMASIRGKLLDMLVTLEREGVANRVFDSSMIPQMERLRAFRRKVAEEYACHLETLQNIYLGNSSGKLPDKTAEKMFSETWLLNGYYQPISQRLAMEIEKAFGRESLKATVGNPVKFFETYQLSAYKNNLFLLDDSLIERLKKDLK